MKAPNERDIDSLLLQAKGDARDTYRGNTAELMSALDRVRQEYVNNAPAWNFVLGNLVDENKHLRSSQRLHRIERLVYVIAFAVAVLVVVLWSFRNGGTRYVPFPVDSKTGATLSNPVRISGWIPASEAEQLRVLRRVIPDLFRADIHHATDESRWADAQVYLSPSGMKDIVQYRSRLNGAYDPFTIGASGRYADVTITRVEPHYVDGGPSLYEVDWSERYTTLDNRDLGTLHRTAEFTVTSSAAAASLDNPQGVQIVHIHWGLAGDTP